MSRVSLSRKSGKGSKRRADRGLQNAFRCRDRYHCGLCIETLEVRALLSAGPMGSGVCAGIQAAVRQQTLADLPIAAQSTISSAIGKDQSAYRAACNSAGVSLANAANGFDAQVQSGALHVSDGADIWEMSLAGLGYGGAEQPVGTAQYFGQW